MRQVPQPHTVEVAGGEQAAVRGDIDRRRAPVLGARRAIAHKAVMERAAFYAAWQEKKLRGLFLTAVGNSGNAASRVDAFIQSKGTYAYGGYPDIDDLFNRQAGERDAKKREAMLHKIQELTIERAMYVPVMDLRVLMGIGPRISKHTVTDIWMSPWPAYEDMEIKD